MEKISVIIPVYNSVKYLEKCLDSVINQTYKNLEIICIDDGSTDGSSQILDIYAKKDIRMKVLHKKNEGLSQARKDGLRIASGQYISHIDSDDWLDLSMYEKMIIKAEEYDVDAVACNYYDVKGDTVYPAVSLPEVLLDNSSYETMIVKWIYNIEEGHRILNWSLWTYLFKREAICKYQNYLNLHVTRSEDIVCVWLFLANANRIYVLDQKLYYYRVKIHNEVKTNKYILDNLDVYEVLKKEFSKLYNAEVLKEMLQKAYCNILISELQNYFMGEVGEFYMFPYEYIPANSKIVLYGAGFVGKSFYNQIKENKYCNISMWVDKEYESIRNQKYNIESPEKIVLGEYDYILIAVRYKRTAESIKLYLEKEKGIPKEKIIVANPKQLSCYM